MTKMICAAALVLALSVCGQAGIIQFDKNEPPPPPPPAATTGATQDEPSAEGTMQFDFAAASSQAALDALQSLLTLF